VDNRACARGVIVGMNHELEGVSEALNPLDTAQSVTSCGGSTVVLDSTCTLSVISTMDLPR